MLCDFPCLSRCKKWKYPFTWLARVVFVRIQRKKDLRLSARVVIRTSTLTILWRRFADNVNKMQQRACRTCSTVIFPHPTNHGIDLWRCCSRGSRRFLNSLLLNGQLSERQFPCHLTVKIYPLSTFLIPNIHEKIYHLDLLRAVQFFFFLTVQKRVNSEQKGVTNQAFWLFNDQRNSQMANQIFCFQIQRTPWMAQLTAQFFPNCVIPVRFFCLTIAKFFHVNF